MFEMFRQASDQIKAAIAFFYPPTPLTLAPERNMEHDEESERLTEVRLDARKWSLGSWEWCEVQNQRE